MRALPFYAQFFGHCALIFKAIELKFTAYPFQRRGLAVVKKKLFFFILKSVLNSQKKRYLLIIFRRFLKNHNFNALNLLFKNVITTERLKWCGMEDRTGVVWKTVLVWYGRPYCRCGSLLLEDKKLRVNLSVFTVHLAETLWAQLYPFYKITLADIVILWLLKLGITMLIHNKDDI